ncbi:MAG: hypothetical protein GXO26_07910 [Crenarchaeota archaeon]|nr:hypothetical protein [Thermoproteota archaeon]
MSSATAVQNSYCEIRDTVRKELQVMLKYRAINKYALSKVLAIFNNNESLKLLSNPILRLTFYRNPDTVSLLLNTNRKAGISTRSLLSRINAIFTWHRNYKEYKMLPKTEDIDVGLSINGLIPVPRLYQKYAGGIPDIGNSGYFTMHTVVLLNKTENKDHRRVSRIVKKDLLDFIEEATERRIGKSDDVPIFRNSKGVDIMGLHYMVMLYNMYKESLSNKEKQYIREAILLSMSRLNEEALSSVVFSVSEYLSMREAFIGEKVVDVVVRYPITAITYNGKTETIQLYDIYRKPYGYAKVTLKHHGDPVRALLTIKSILQSIIPDTYPVMLKNKSSYYTAAPAKSILLHMMINETLRSKHVPLLRFNPSTWPTLDNISSSYKAEQLLAKHIRNLSYDHKCYYDWTMLYGIGACIDTELFSLHLFKELLEKLLLKRIDIHYTSTPKMHVQSIKRNGEITVLWVEPKNNYLVVRSDRDRLVVRTTSDAALINSVALDELDYPLKKFINPWFLIDIITIRGGYALVYFKEKTPVLIIDKDVRSIEETIMEFITDRIINWIPRISYPTVIDMYDLKTKRLDTAKLPILIDNKHRSAIPLFYYLTREGIQNIESIAIQSYRHEYSRNISVLTIKFKNTPYKMIVEL